MTCTRRLRIDGPVNFLRDTACGWLASGRVTLDGDRVVFDGKRLDQPIMETLDGRN